MWCACIHDSFQFLFIWLKILIFIRYSKKCTWFGLGFLLVHNLKKVFWTTLLGTLFNMYVKAFKGYPHNNIGNNLLLIIVLTISISVLHLSVMSSRWDVLSNEYYVKISFCSKKLAYGRKLWPPSSYTSTIVFSTIHHLYKDLDRSKIVLVCITSNSLKLLIVRYW